MLTIPLQAMPSQSLRVMLNGQLCSIRIYTLSTGLYLDLSVLGVEILQTQLCVDRAYLVRDAYLGFIGDLAFVDTLSGTDPVYTGLGTQYQLIYFAPADLPARL